MYKILFLWMLLLPFAVLAQEENVWAFGSEAGLDFNSSTVTAFQSSINSPEGIASVCDAKGKLLFYTDGTFVWNANHAVMPNGNDILGLPWVVMGGGTKYPTTISTTQGALISTIPDQPGKYLLFSLTSEENKGTHCKLFYSMVDMSLNGGLGDVVSSMKGIVIDSFLTEKLTGVIGDNCNIWVLVHTKNHHEVRAYEITSAGLNLSPVISTITSASANPVVTGTIKISPNRKQMIISPLMLYDFDAASGIVSGGKLLQSMPSYSACFSPDNSKLYTQEALDIYQYDLTKPSLTEIINSRTLITMNVGFIDLKAGPDGKIYMASGSSERSSLAVINQPNAAGKSCNYVKYGVSLAPNTSMNLGLPNDVPVFRRDSFSTTNKLEHCFNTNITLDPVMSDGRDHVWSNGTTGKNITVADDGFYWVSYFRPPCDHYIDTFELISNNITPELDFIANRDSICEGDTILFTPSYTEGVAEITWTFGSGSTTLPAGAQTHRFDTSGTITITAVASFPNCPDVSVSHDVNVFSYPRVDIGPDTTVCLNGQAILLSNHAHKPFTDFSYQWGNGSHDQQIAARHPGTYVLTVTSGRNCATVDSVEISKSCYLDVPNAFTPNGDGVNDYFVPRQLLGKELSKFSMQVFDRWGQLVFKTETLNGRGWDGTLNGKEMGGGVFVYLVEAEFENNTMEQHQGNITLVK